MPTEVEHIKSRSAEVGPLQVRRALPTRGHRTVGAWCFADHMGPQPITEELGVDVAPHPHMGLQTVTWLFDGELVHRDSLGTEQPVRAGQLNLMTAGHGVAHSEESPGRRAGVLHGIQLWVAQPKATRDGEAAFEHHTALPTVELGCGTATVLVGTFGAETSPARRDTDHVAAELSLAKGSGALGVDAAHEHALVVVAGSVAVDGSVVVPGELAYLPAGRAQLELEADGPCTAMLVGGVPFPEEVLMFWNFVARTHDEVGDPYRQWQTGDPRFGRVDSALPRVRAPRPVWLGGA